MSQRIDEKLDHKMEKNDTNE